MKTTQRRGVSDARAQQTTRVNVRIDAEAQRRLAVHCAMTGLLPGEVITRLIHSLRDWSMPVNLSARAHGRDRQAADAHVTPDAPDSALEVAA